LTSTRRVSGHLCWVIFLGLGWCKMASADPCMVFNGVPLQGVYDCVPVQLSPWTYFYSVNESSVGPFTSAVDAYAGFVAQEDAFLAGCHPSIGPLSDFSPVPPLLGGTVSLSESATAPVTQSCFGSPVTDQVFGVGRQRFTICPDGYQRGFFADGSGPTCYAQRAVTPNVVQIRDLSSIEPSQTLMAAAVVTDSSGAPISGAVVRLRVDALANSGGHIHGDDRDSLRRGNLNGTGPEIIAAVPTGADGTFSFEFNAPAVAGTYILTASCDNMPCTQQGPKTIDVKIDGLVPVQPCSFCMEVGSTQVHPDNHYLTPSAEFKEEVIALVYHTDPTITSPILALNDASLVWGGIFDLDADWQMPHREHDKGTVIDIRANGAVGSIVAADFKEFQTILSINGATWRFESQGTPNQHYHVRLLGRY